MSIELSGKNINMKILLLTQWFDPEPTFKGLAFAKELIKQGHEVEVLTGFPNYPQGKLYDGYKLKLFQRENIDGVSVLRVPLYASHDNSAFKRVLNYASFAVSATLYGIFLTKKADVIYAYHPPLTVDMAALLIKLFRRIPIVLDIQDMWPDTLKATGMIGNEKLLNIVDILCKVVYRYADHIVVLSPGFKQLLEKRNVAASKISVIYNWCDESSLNLVSEISAENQQILDNKFNVVFAGNMGKAQSLDTVIEVAKQLKNESRIQFVFVGQGTETQRLKQICEDSQIDNVKFIPQMPMQKVGAILRKADVLLVYLRNDPLFEITIPSKTQASMAIGKPIIMGVSGDASNLMKEADCGVVVIPENSESLKTGILELYHLEKNKAEKLANNAKIFYQNNLSITSGVKKFIDIFKKVSQKC